MNEERRLAQGCKMTLRWKSCSENWRETLRRVVVIEVGIEDIHVPVIDKHEDKTKDENQNSTAL
jgi:hypothetical protein